MFHVGDKGKNQFSRDISFNLIRAKEGSNVAFLWFSKDVKEDLFRSKSDLCEPGIWEYTRDNKMHTTKGSHTIPVFLGDLRRLHCFRDLNFWVTQTGQPKNSHGDSVYQKYTCFMLKMRIKLGSFGLFWFLFGLRIMCKEGKCEGQIFGFFGSKVQICRGGQFQTCLNKWVHISESANIGWKK